MNAQPGHNKLGRRIAPGIWKDADGYLHFSLPELLALVDLEDNAENREIVTNMLKKTIKERFPDAEIRERARPED